LRVYGGVIAGAFVLMTFGGCFGKSGQSCEYWVNTLSKGKKEKQSIIKIGELGCTDGVTQLLERFPETMYRREVLISLKQLGKSDKAIEIVTMALPDKEVGPLAISLGIEWRVDSLKADLSKLIRKQRSASTRLQALEALVDLITPQTLVVGEGENGTLTFEGRPGRSVGNILFVDSASKDHAELLPGINVNGADLFIKGDFAKGVTGNQIADMINGDNEASQLVAITVGGDGSGKHAAMTRGKPLGRIITDETLIKTLTWVVGQEPTLQGVDTNQYGADRLAEVDWKKVSEEVGTAAAQNLVKALFMKDAKNNSAQINARFALRTIGSLAVDPILTAFQGVNKELNEFAEIRGLAKWRYTQGHELVEMLWDVGDKRASPELMKAIGIPLDPPPPDVARLPEDQRTEWKMANQNRLTTTALTVGALPNDDAVKYAEELLLRKNPPPDATQFVQAGLGLALMGTDKSRAALWKLYREGGDVKEIRGKIAALKAEIEKMSKGEAKTAKMQAHDALIDDVNRIESTRANYVTNLAVGLGPKESGAFKAELMSLEKGPIKESANQPLPTAYFNVVADCGNKLPCYVKRLESARDTLNDIPKTIMEAQKTLGTEKTRVSEKAKPITEKIRAQNKLTKEKLTAILAVKDKIEKEKLPDKEKNELIAQFNTGLDEYNAMREATEKIYLERNVVLAELDPFKVAFSKSQEALHELEKVALVMGTIDGADAHLGLLAEVFHKASAPAFTQYRQWALISLEHLANKSHLDVLEELLLKEKGDDGRKTTFWTLRLDSLIQRVKRS